MSKPMATDKARAAMNERLANPQPGYWNKLREAMKSVAIKCKMMCDDKKETSNTISEEKGDCPYTEDV